MFFRWQRKTKRSLYAVALFLPREETDNLIDLIPSSWIITSEHDALCRYLGPKDYSKLLDRLSSLKEYEGDWECFNIEIISFARK